MRRWLALVGVAAFLWAPVALFAADSADPLDWPKWRGPNGDGISPETGINKNWAEKPPKVLWKVSLGDEGYAGPSVADGKLFIIDHKGSDDIVRAIDINTGKDVWTFSYPDASKPNEGFALSTPVYDDGRLYTISQLGKVHCLDATTGDKVWMLDMAADLGGRRPPWDMAGSPFIDGDKLILTPGGANAAVAAVDKLTGKTIWKGGGGDKPGYATPVVANLDGKKQYVVFTAKHLIGVDSENGGLLWSFPWETGYDVNAATPIVVDDTIFITSGYKHGCALVKVAGGRAEAVWQNQEIQSQFSTPILVDGYVYGTSDPGRLVCLELKTGKVVWSQKGFQKGGLVGVDGTIIVVDGANGNVAMAELTPQGYQELGRFKPLGGQSWTAPIVAQGKLFVRNKGALVAIDLK